MDNRSILIGLHELEGIGWKTILRLINRLPELQEIFAISAAELTALGIGREQAELISRKLTASYVESKLTLYANMRICTLTLFDSEYPAILKEIAQPPWVLYYKGNIPLINLHLLSIVGTRMPTAYGKKVAEDFAFSISNLGFGIVSGMARGIDSYAHRGALKGSGRTIAVLGCAIDQVYPPENRILSGQIEEQGLIVSEYPIGAKMHPGMFPYRNRIIAGLSLGVVVVEAAKRSGSLITVDLAIEESRDVFAVPGQITSPKSQGVLPLIKQGCKILTTIEDIKEEYVHLFPKEASAVLQSQQMAPALTEDELEIMQILTEEPANIDSLLELSQFTFGHLHSILLSLSMKKQITQLPGSTYMKL
ncbi:DNA-processing protein DprA [Paenibacillus eucommiae]|uniref:DNA processing protein n=1 Tax=Paenibacillus eucommiae TaxID=1355755 RepID=A0ABS4IUU7_9BACL|nr:DNA-processing protein DprA [Paenibacillus eucommiae]MBP1991350.1 DNA processing protein [Paenibacillus eucommiae]